LCALTWRDAQPTPDGATGVVTVRGKGDAYRAVRLPPAVWRALVALGRGAPDAPVFASRAGGGHLTRQQVWRLIHRAGERAGLATRAMPHGLRHSHVSHALSRGAPAHLVQATAGHASLATTGRYAHALPADSSGRYLPL
jgi:integrase/recombinase XerD